MDSTLAHLLRFLALSPEFECSLEELQATTGLASKDIDEATRSSSLFYRVVNSGGEESRVEAIGATVDGRREAHRLILGPSSARPGRPHA